MTANITTQVNRPYLPESGGGISCEIDVDPGDLDQVSRRHIALCVDASGSMDNRGKVQQVRDATNLVFGLLNDDDYLSIVTFDTDVEVVMEATRWGDVDRDDAEKRVERIIARGGTDVYAGLTEAKRTLEEIEAGPGVAKRVLLLSDGRDTSRTATEFGPLAAEVAEEGISIYSAGIGTHYDKDVIRTLGESSQGRWVHVDSPGDIRSFFGDVVEEASTVVANNPRLLIEPTEQVEIAEVYRRLPQVQAVDPTYEDDDVVVGLPDLVENEAQTITLKMDAPGGEVGSSRVLASVTLDAGGPLANAEVTIEYSDDPAELARQNDDVFIAHRDTVIRSEIARADDQEALAAVEDLIEETEVIAGGDTEVTADLKDTVTRIEQGSEEEVREVQEKTTVIHEDDRFE